MIVRSLQLEGFRNLATQSVELGAGLNLLHGDNGQGKTNALEAIHLLSSLRSFRACRLREIIGHGLARAELRAQLTVGRAPLALRLVLEPGGRRTWLGERPARDPAEFLGQLQAVAFTPDDLAMVKGAPAQRRRFLDRAAFLLQPAHLLLARDFSLALRARNRLLRTGRFQPEELSAFSETLARLGAELTARRRACVERLGPAFQRVCGELLGRPAAAGLGLQAGWREAGGERGLLGELQAGLERDRRRGATGVGPQLDDLELGLDGQPARRFASQGQQRTLAVALLLALVDEVVGGGAEQPVLLLDDVSSELDAGNRRRLFERVGALAGQVLVTTTDAGLLGELRGAARVFEVRDGRLLARQ
ncbi:MAG TPA: DNA replication/repair protein RecF [Myxococcota bacterium]|nr:DNA replication/repair protein RecF [Myxococcota bacterium]HRY92901.1 DNA replication/repair protein RecF [Myxococcota bacterium]HSA20894.1 DNA replication/repair protein RecF [Myxococcota bacterium]